MRRKREPFMRFIVPDSMGGSLTNYLSSEQRKVVARRAVAILRARRETDRP